MRLGGTTVTHDGIAYDYCFEEVVTCLLEVCDEVAVVDGYSDDGTWEKLLELQSRHPKLKLGQVPWDPPDGIGFSWLDNICEQAKAMLTSEMHLFLCADEVVDRSEYDVIRHHSDNGHTVACNRYTFWGGHSDLYLPDENPVRIGPVQLKCVGAAGELDRIGEVHSRPPVHIFHYGFLRNPVALARKSRKLQTANHICGCDPIFDAVEKEGVTVLTDSRYPTAVPVERLKKLPCPHPKIMHNWLRQHGYNL